MNNGALAYAGSLVQAESLPYFERVLFTTDFSESSLKALPLAGAVARTFGSELRMVYALTPGDQICAVPEFTGDLTELLEREANERLLALKSSCNLTSVKVGACQVFTGGLGALSNKIAADEIDLVVMSTHGSRGFRRFLLGSVAEDLIHSASCPVLTVGPRVVLKEDDLGFHPKHILFATDASADSFRPMPYAVQFAQRQYSDLTLVHVLTKGHEGIPEADAFAALMRFGLHHTLPLAAIKNCSPEIVVRFGNPVEEILKVGRERGSELIVMGARSSTNRAMFSRSVSYGVIAQATCPVLTVRGAR